MADVKITTIMAELSDETAKAKVWAYKSAAEEAAIYLGALEASLNSVVFLYENDIANADNGDAINNMLEGIRYMAGKMLDDIREMMK